MNRLPEINDVVESMAQETPFSAPARILWIDRENDQVVLMTISNPPRAPWSFSWTTLNALLKESRLRYVEIAVPSYMKVLDNELPDEEKAIRDANWNRIKPLIKSRRVGEIFAPGAMGKMIAERALEIAKERNSQPDRKSLYRLLYRYWLFGGLRNALLRNFANFGAPGTSRQYTKGKLPGRPPKALGVVSDLRAKVLSDDDKQAIRLGYALYKNNEVKTQTDAYVRTLNKFYRVHQSIPGFSDDDVVLKPLADLPTITQFQYWGKKAFDDITVMRSRKGERKWEKDHRAIKGRANQGLHGPCHRYEIDATIADVYLVSRFNRNWIIGRPVVYVIVDVFSRMIVGIFVGLEGPSWNGARQALLNAFSDKVSFCAAHGIQIRKEDWPCFHLPQEICADRGEMLGYAAEEGVVSGLGIDLAIAPPYRPDWKAIVESRFRLLNQLTQIHWTPGGVAERIKERGQRDYRLDATLDLKEFTKIMIASVLHYNHHSRQPDWMNQDMIAQNIDPTPIGIWNWGIGHGMGTPNVRSDELVKLYLMNKSSATVRAGGVYFKGMYYVAEDGSDDSRYARARAKGREKIDVWHDATKPETIWIRNEDKSLKCCVLRESESRYRDHRLEEIEDMLHIIAHTTPEKRYATLASRVNLDEHIQSTINTATAEKNELEKPASKAEQLNNIRGNRAVERLVQQVLEGAVSAVPSQHQVMITPPAADDAFGARSGEVIDFLSQLRKKKQTP